MSFCFKWAKRWEAQSKMENIVGSLLDCRQINFPKQNQGKMKWCNSESESEVAQCVRLFATLCTVAYQASLSMGFSRQEYWSGLPFPSPGDLPNPGIEPGSPASEADALTSEPPGKPLDELRWTKSKPLSSLLIPFVHVLGLFLQFWPVKLWGRSEANVLQLSEDINKFPVNKIKMAQCNVCVVPSFASDFVSLLLVLGQ